MEVSKRKTEKPSQSRAERDSGTQWTEERDEDCANGDETISSSRPNGAVVSPEVEGTSDEFVIDADEGQSHRQNVVAVLVIFTASLLVLALLFKNFPELDE